MGHWELTKAALPRDVRPETQVNGWKLATTINMAVIFFIFGVTLDSSELLTAVKAWKAVVFGLASMLFLTPLFGFIAVRLPFEASGVPAAVAWFLEGGMHAADPAHAFA